MDSGMLNPSSALLHLIAVLETITYESAGIAPDLGAEIDECALVARPARIIEV